MGLVGVLAPSDENPDGSVDGGQLSQSRRAGDQCAWRQVGIEDDSFIAVSKDIAEIGGEIDESAGGGGVQADSALRVGLGVESGQR